MYVDRPNYKAIENHKGANNVNVEEFLSNFWAHLKVDDSNIIRFANDAALKWAGQSHIIGTSVMSCLPWFRYDWLMRQKGHRVVKTSLVGKIILDIIPEQERPGWYHLFFRSVEDYDDPGHLWCEVAGSIIGVQRFIDTSYDGIFVADGQGKVLAVNQAFLHISGLSSEEVVDKSLENLIELGLIPGVCSLQAVQDRGEVSGYIKFPYGREAIISCMPLTDKQGNIIRILANVRDITELNALHEKLKKVTILAAKCDLKLRGMQPVYTGIDWNLIRSDVMRGLHDLITRVANTDSQMLITGESGIGKTAVAKFVHALSDRSKTGNFIHVNCSAIPETLLESELFGFEEGAFTGAKKAKTGYFEMAKGGTLFLDEIGDMPLSLQSKILNVLQERKFYRVGGVKEINTDVRIITATNANLEELMAKGRFRLDLYYRINVIPVSIPPLRNRIDDIPPLLTYYLQCSNQKHNQSKTISPEVLEVLLRYEWPGNIRELINLIERMVLVVDEKEIKLKHLPFDIIIKTRGAVAVKQDTGGIVSEAVAGILNSGVWQPKTDLKELTARIENVIIDEAILACGSLKKAAKNLGVDVTTLIRKRKRHGSNDGI